MSRYSRHRGFKAGVKNSRAKRKKHFGKRKKKG